MTALRGGDAQAATTAFTSACAVSHAALAEDACFWSGAAVRRAGQTAAARRALEQFVQRFPSSARAGEAAALLGWILFEAGELSGAEHQFQRCGRPRAEGARERGPRAGRRRVGAVALIGFCYDPRMDAPGIPYGLLVLVIIVMPVCVTVALGLFLLKQVELLAYHCRRCGGEFRRKAHRRFPEACPLCRARDWNAPPAEDAEA